MCKSIKVTGCKVNIQNSIAKKKKKLNSINKKLEIDINE